MIQIDLFEGLSQSFHKSVLAIVDQCWRIIDSMTSYNLCDPIQLPLFKTLFHPGWGCDMECAA